MDFDLKSLQKIARQEPPVCDADGNALELKIHCRNCGVRLDVGGLTPLSYSICPDCNEAVIVPQYFAGLLIQKFCTGTVDSFVAYAYDPVLDRDVALKISKTAAESFGGVRLLNAAKTLSLITGPGIMPVFDCGIWNDFAYFVMPWMSHGSLQDMLKRPASEQFTLKQTALFLSQLPAALDKAQQLGFGHYDINPKNIFIDFEWHAFLSNFRSNDEYADFADNPEGLTRFDGWKYFSSDVLTGATPGTEDDIFSLGVTFYEALSGFYPYGEITTPEQLLQQHYRMPEPNLLLKNPAVNKATAELIVRMCANDSFARPTCEEITTVTQQLLSQILENSR